MENIEVLSIGVEFAIVLAGDFVEDAAFFQSGDCLRGGRRGNTQGASGLGGAGDGAALEMLMKAEDR